MVWDSFSRPCEFSGFLVRSSLSIHEQIRQHSLNHDLSFERTIRAVVLFKSAKQSQEFKTDFTHASIERGGTL